jgi:beta-xylosidase
MYFDNSIANSVSLFSDEGFILPSYFKNSNFNNLPLEYLLDASDESFDAFKSSLSLYTANNKSQVLSSNNYLNPLSYSSIVDPFRADYEDQL